MAESLGSYPKGQFFKNTVYLERGMPYLRLCLQMQCLSRKNDVQRVCSKIDEDLIFNVLFV